MIFNETQPDPHYNSISQDNIEITLIFLSDDLDKNEITNLIEHLPTNSWNASEVLEIGSAKKMIVAETGKWYLKHNTIASKIDDGISSLLNSLCQDMDVWNILSNKYNGFIEISAYQHLWNHSYYLKPEVLNKLAKRNLGLNFDIYNINIFEVEQ